MAKAITKNRELTYISLFSSAGVGCFGFKQEKFHCIATVELIERRLKIQKFNHKCDFESGYICGDMTTDETKEKVYTEIRKWTQRKHTTGIDVLIATPPCQGMSVANHKKHPDKEIKRNSLVIESIGMTENIKPKFFVFENVQAFLDTMCIDSDETAKSIREAIENRLGGLYNILYKVINFKDYGNPSSRTRTLVLGVRKDILDITPYDIFPDRHKEVTLREAIGNLPPLNEMGEICPTDIYHSFRPYPQEMLLWIENLKEGESAFDNSDLERRPHHLDKEGNVVENVNKNGDKYTRQFWDKVAPCIHTRNDQLASQSTIHPRDNRVLSIRELMVLMSIPSSFKWSEYTLTQLNELTLPEKTKFIKQEEINIRQNIGEAVPTIIFNQIAKKIRTIIENPSPDRIEINNIIKDNNLSNPTNLNNFILQETRQSFCFLSKIAELSNAERENNAAYYTRPDIAYSVVKELPDAKDFSSIKILEPSIGVGNFLPCLISKYADVKNVDIDVVDIDSQSIATLKSLIQRLSIPKNFRVNYIVDDFLTHNFEKRYDIVIGNPPYKKLPQKDTRLAIYKNEAINQDTNNIFAFFIEKALRLGRYVSLIVPKSLINSPEFNQTRNILESHKISSIIDFGEKGFKNVKIETISFLVDTRSRPDCTKIISYIDNTSRLLRQPYITAHRYPYWLIYRNPTFDQIAETIRFGIFSVFRDRQLTQKNTLPQGRFRVLKSRDIGDNEIFNIPGYDRFVNEIESFSVTKYFNRTDCILVPNLTYNPRACFMPNNCLADGSVAILTRNNPQQVITEQDLAFFASPEFSYFYSIARNKGTRSLNIDSNSVFFFGIRNIET